MPYYKLIVAYDGSRFNGFQRQITNADMQARMQQTQQSKNGDGGGDGENDGGLPQRQLPLPPAYRTVPKRPHWESNGRKKRTAATVQDCLEDAIGLWTSQGVADIGLKFAGRTDKGVHARGQVVVVRLPEAHEDEGEVVNAVNTRLPTDISVVEAELLQLEDELGDPDTAPRVLDPRRDAVAKQYSYTVKFRRAQAIDPSAERPPACDKSGSGPHAIRHALDDGPCVWVVPWGVDDSRFPDLCRALRGRHDFVAFVHKHNRGSGGSGADVLTLDRMDYEVLSEKSVGGASGAGAAVVTARFTLEAKGFRRSLVRNLVGFCIDVGRDREGPSQLDWDRDLWSPAAAAHVHAAPACGLCLEWVKY